MAITLNPGNLLKVPSTPSLNLPDPQDQKKQIKNLEKDKKNILNIKKDIQDSVVDINKSLEETFGKTAKLVCLLRLDMVADRLDNSGLTRLSKEIDKIANALETAV
jgi:hypothetical protein